MNPAEGARGLPVEAAASRSKPADMLRRTIYLSSTYADLGKARSAIANAIERLQGHTVIGMEGYLASDQRPLDRCLSDVAMCDYYVGVIAWRYGFVPPGETRSITELELREAIRSNKPRLLFVLDEKARWPPELRDADAGRIRALRSELMDTHLVSVFKSTGELPLLAGVAVANQTMLELRGVRDVAHAELRQGLVQLERVLVFLAWLPVTATIGLKTPSMPTYLPRGRQPPVVDLRDEGLVDALRHTSISPPRPLNAPYDATVPFGTDRRMIDAIVSSEATAARERLRSVMARYSAAELGVEALHAAEDVLGHRFLRYLEQIKESAAARRFMEDSESLAVPILDSGISGGSCADYLGFVDALDSLSRASAPTHAAP
jgi:hypothetical protein